MRPMWASDPSGIWWCSELCLPILKLRFDLEIEPQGTLWLGGSRQCWERWIFLEALSPNFHRNARQSRNLQVSNRKTSPNRLHGRIHYWIYVSSSTFSGPKNLLWANIKVTSRLSVFFSRVPKRLLRRMFWHPTSNIRCECFQGIFFKCSSTSLGPGCSPAPESSKGNRNGRNRSLDGRSEAQQLATSETYRWSKHSFNQLKRPDDFNPVVKTVEKWLKQPHNFHDMFEIFFWPQNVRYPRSTCHRFHRGPRGLVCGLLHTAWPGPTAGFSMLCTVKHYWCKRITEYNAMLGYVAIFCSRYF